MGVLAVTAVVIALIVIRSRGDDPAAGAIDADAGAAEAAATADETDDTALTPATPRARGPSDQLRAAVVAFDRALQTEQVVSAVNLAPAQPSVMLISSVYCNDSSLRRVLTRHASGLRSSGVSLVRCSSREGRVVFEKKL